MYENKKENSVEHNVEGSISFCFPKLYEFQLPGPINSNIKVKGIITLAARMSKHPRRRRGDTAVNPIVFMRDPCDSAINSLLTYCKYKKRKN